MSILLDQWTLLLIESIKLDFFFYSFFFHLNDNFKLKKENKEMIINGHFA